MVHTLLGLKAPASVVASGGMYEFPNDRDMPDTIVSVRPTHVRALGQ